MKLSDLSQLQEAHVLAEIRRRQDERPQAFAMSAKRDEWPVAAMAEQIACRQKAALKMPSWLGHDVLMSTEACEQASSEWTAKAKLHLFPDAHKWRVLDLCAGLGLDAFAWAQAGHQLHYNDLDPLKVELARWNAEQLGISIAQISCQDAADCLAEQADQNWDLILIDPSRRQNGQRVLSLAAYQPNLESLWPTLQTATRYALIKLAPGIDAAALDAILPDYEQMISVSLDGEAKERLVLVDFQAATAARQRMALCLGRDDACSIWRSANAMATVAKADAALTYVYDPDPAILLAGLSSEVAAHFQLQVLSQSHGQLRDSHAALFTSEDLHKDFPGRVFQLENQQVFHRKSVRKYLKNKQIERAHVWRCQSKSSVKDLRRLLNLADGDQASICVYRDQQQRDQFLHLQRLAP